MAVHTLAQVRFAAAASPGLAGASHVSRRLQARLASGDGTAAAGLQEEYARQAAGWLEWTASQPDYLVPLDDALDRAGIGRPSLVLELGGGAGPATGLIERRLSTRIVVIDLAIEMLALARSGAHLVQADVRALPVASAAVDVVVAMNSVIDWREVRRVLRPQGRALVVSSYGEQTPLYHSLTEVMKGWPGARIVTAKAGHGDWFCLQGDT